MRILVKDETHAAFGNVVADAFPDVEFAILRGDRSLTPSVDDFDVAWGSQGIFLDLGPGSFLDRVERAGSLRWFQSSGAGNDQPIISTLLDRGVIVTGIHVHSISIAEAVIRGVLDRFQNAQAWRDAQSRQEWAPHWFKEVHGSTWMVVGVGSIGTEVAVRARALGARVVGVRRTPTGDEPVDEMIAPGDVASRLTECDVVVLAADRNPSTLHLVDTTFLQRMKQGAVLVNPSRGSLVDEAALIRALDSGHLGAAVLDSFAEQPLPPGHPFWSHPRIDVTPHSTARGSGRAARSAAFFLENLRRFRGGLPLLDRVRESNSVHG